MWQITVTRCLPVNLNRSALCVGKFIFPSPSLSPSFTPTPSFEDANARVFRISLTNRREEGRRVLEELGRGGEGRGGCTRGMRGTKSWAEQRRKLKGVEWRERETREGRKVISHYLIHEVLAAVPASTPRLLHRTYSHLRLLRIRSWREDSISKISWAFRIIITGFRNGF